LAPSHSGGSWFCTRKRVSMSKQSG
jgi:hypothetical protein